MPLLRGFSKVDEGGVITIPSNIRNEAGLFPGTPIKIKVIRIKNTNRWPNIIIHSYQVSPKLSMFQVVMMEEDSQMDANSRLIFKESVLEEAKLEPDSRLEIKLLGPKNGSWIVIHYRGPIGLTTLQEKIGRLGKNGKKKKWKSMSIKY